MRLDVNNRAKQFVISHQRSFLGGHVAKSPVFQEIIVYNAKVLRQIFARTRRQIIIMTTPNHFKLETDHLQTIKALAEEMECPVEVAEKIYGSALQELKSRARIQDYLNVLASKKARDRLHHL